MPNSRSFISVGNISSLRQIVDDRFKHLPSYEQDGRNFRSKRAMHRFLFLVVVAVLLSLTGCAKKVLVPDVTQQDLDQAEKALTGLQLKVGTVSGIPSGNTTG